jgi:hypothetical protein
LLPEEQCRKRNPSRRQQLHLRILEAVCFVELSIFKHCFVELGIFEHCLFYHNLVVGNSIEQRFGLPLPSSKRTDHY